MMTDLRTNETTIEKNREEIANQETLQKGTTGFLAREIFLLRRQRKAVLEHCRRIAVLGSEELLNRVVSDYIQRLEVISGEDLDAMGISQEQFNQYVVTHAHLLAMVEGDLDHELLKPLRENLSYDKERDLYIFNRDALRQKIQALQQAFKAYQQILAAA